MLILAGDNISLLGENVYLIGNGVYAPEDMSLGASTAAAHTSASKVKQEASLITQ